MESPLDLLRKATEKRWLVNGDGGELLHLTKELLIAFDNPTPLKIIVSESDPGKFLGTFIAACTHNHQIFLASPHWGESEWEKVCELVQPDLICGDNSDQVILNSLGNKVGGGVSLNPEIMIATGGTSGTIRFATHTWDTLTASVHGFCQYFQLEQVNCFCVLPLYHVSGLMQVMRCLTTGGKLMITSFQELKEGKYLDFDPGKFFISLVPTQLQALISNAELREWLSGFHTVLLGGAPAWGDVLQKALEYDIKVALCYGMTETASGIAILKPVDFFRGHNHNGQVLPHAQVKISERETGRICEDLEVGSVVIESDSIALGYYPQRFSPQSTFVTDDLGFLDEFGCLHIVGRHSDKIITGGENVFPFEVEQVIRATGLVKDVQIIAVPHSYWGEMIAAIYVPNNEKIFSQHLEKAIAGKLARFKEPKIWIVLEEIPRNLQGKVNRQQFQELVKQYL